MSRAHARCAATMAEGRGHGLLLHITCKHRISDCNVIRYPGKVFCRQTCQAAPLFGSFLELELCGVMGKTFGDHSTFLGGLQSCVWSLFLHIVIVAIRLWFPSVI